MAEEQSPFKPLATMLVHGDESHIMMEASRDVAPPIHVSVTFQIDNEPKMHYARNDQPTRQRAELMLGKLEGGTAVMYSSGMAACFAALQYFRPKRVAIDRGYHLTHDCIHKYFKDDTDACMFDLDAEYRAGDMIWLETPNNPTCELRDMKYYADKAHAVGAIVVVDSTFASPVLQNPLEFGVDVVHHSCTKYLSGHDDVMAGVLVAKDQKVGDALKAERTIIGNIPGSLECFLLLRSLRTLSLRVEKQSLTAANFAKFVSQLKGVAIVCHPSLPNHPGYALCKKQMRGPPGILSVEFTGPELTQLVLKKLKVFTQATSLGGCMSLVDWRHRRDPKCSPNLLRISIGLEDADDLNKDFEQAIREGLKELGQ